MSSSTIQLSKADTPHGVLSKVNNALRMSHGVEFSFSAADSPAEASFAMRHVSGHHRTNLVPTVPAPYNSFASRLCRGKVRASLLDAFIELWHKSKGQHADIHTYLGLTKEEYRAWVETNDYAALRASVLSRAVLSRVGEAPHG